MDILIEDLIRTRSSSEGLKVIEMQRRFRKIERRRWALRKKKKDEEPDQEM